MIFVKDLIFKGVAGLAVVGSAGAGVWWYTTQKPENNTQNEPTNEPNDLNTLAEKVGLECTAGTTPTATEGVQCNKRTGSASIKVKKDSSSFNLSDISGSGKIKVYKLTAAEGGTTDYNKNFKFVIEEADIGTTPNKLEEFETYEVKEETEGGGEWKLTRKEKAVDVKKKLLGLPSEDVNCKLPESGNNSVECQLDEAKLKKINFEDKGSGEVTIDNGSEQPDTELKLKITITPSGEEAEFPHGYKFVLESNKDISFTNGNKSIKKNTNTEFKIKKSGTSLSLEKAWTAKSLGQKVGLVCNEPSNTDKTCTLTNGSINVHNGTDDKKYSGLSKKTGTSDDKKVKYEEDAGDHNQGIKFYVEGNDDISLQNGEQNDDENKKIVKMGTATYEIKKDGDGTWYLTKKSPAA